MKLRYSIATVLIVTTASAIGLAVLRHLSRPPVYQLPTFECESFPVYGDVGTKRYVTEVTESVIDRSPRWDRRNANPPLSANDAVVIADRFRKRLIEEGKLDPAPESSARWVLDSAHLVPFQAQQGKWFWLVHFWIDMDQTGSLNEIRLVVLMDGTVIEPEIQPES